MNNNVLFSSKSDEWYTPHKLFKELDNKYNFVFDLAFSKENCKTRDGFTIKENALNQDWYVITRDCINDGLTGWLWLNPPYSKCKEFVDKAYSEMFLGAKIVMLIPSRTDTKWFHNYIYKKEGVSIEFIKGRLKFGDSKNSAPFPSMLVEFNK
jgi:site-specific DNA-methyltransferase (adenine-specific)